MRCCFTAADYMSSCTRVSWGFRPTSAGHETAVLNTYSTVHNRLHLYVFCPPPSLPGELELCDMRVVLLYEIHEAGWELWQASIPTSQFTAAPV